MFWPHCHSTEHTTALTDVTSALLFENRASRFWTFDFDTCLTALPYITLESLKTNAIFRFKTRCAFATPPSVLTLKNSRFTSKGIFMQYSHRSRYALKYCFVYVNWISKNKQYSLCKKTSAWYVSHCDVFLQLHFRLVFLDLPDGIFYGRVQSAFHCLKPFQKKKKGTLLSWHVRQSTLQSTLLSAILLQDILVGGGGLLKLSPNENNWYCINMLTTITSIIFNTFSISMVT